MTRERVVIAPVGADAPAVAALLARARRRGFHKFVLSAAGARSARAEDEVIVRQGRTLRVNGRSTVPIVDVADPAELRRLLERVPKGGAVAITWAQDRVIPLENAIAARRGRFEVWTLARSIAEVPGALGALEHGADRVIVEVRDPSDIDALEGALEGPLPTHLEWATLRVDAVHPAGVGDRVIVDTTSLLRPDEGLLVGSAAAFLFHVASEAVGSKFSRARPFRVNAGAAHSYVLMADGSTRYLAELLPGDSVLVTRPGVEGRSVRVGRLKVERRPMVQVVANDAKFHRTIFLQEAETVRLSGPTRRISTTDIRPSIQVRGVRLAPARHLGQAIDETIEER